MYYEEVFRKLNDRETKFLAVDSQIIVEFKKSKKGYQQHITFEQIREYSKLPIKKRLEWLEKSNKFLYEIGFTAKGGEIFPKFEGKNPTNRFYLTI